MKTILTTLILASTLVAFADAALGLRKAARAPYQTKVESERLTKEQEIIALTILGEARGEGERGMYAVACVIQQRMVNKKQNGINICTKWKQFSCWNNLNDKLKHLLDGSKQHSYAVKLAKAMTSGVNLDRKAMNFADHYCTLKCNPYWAFKKVRVNGELVKVAIKPVKIIGNHKFFRLQ